MLLLDKRAVDLKILDQGLIDIIAMEVDERQ
jgi:hypothetical protein